MVATAIISGHWYWNSCRKVTLIPAGSGRISVDVVRVRPIVRSFQAVTKA